MIHRKVMTKNLEVSFNSPQCGWMSIGFEAGGAEFHTTTAHAPHEQALSQLLKILTALLDETSAQNEFLLKWNRKPEEFDFEFSRMGENLRLQIFQYPTDKRAAIEREKKFDFTGNVREICEAFYATFAQMREDAGVDEFEQNWRQSFPQREFEEFKEKLKYA